MKRKLALALTMAMMGTSLIGCGSNAKEDSAPTKANEPAATTQAAATQAADAAQNDNKEWFGTDDGKTITLRFWGGVQPEYGYDELCANFNEQYKDKGLQVEYVRYVNDSNGNLQLETYLMGGGDVDCFIGYGGRARLDARVESNLLFNMSDKLKEYDFDLIEELGSSNMADYIWEDGSSYGFPTKYENNKWILINVDMFNEAGVEIPYDGWTYSEFLDACEKLTHGEGQDKVYGLCWNRKQSGSNTSALLPSVLGAYNIYKNDEGSEVNFDNEVWRESYEMVMKTYENGWAIPLEDEYSEDVSVANTFLKGKCAIALGTAQMRLCMDQENYPHDFKTAIVPGPVPDDEKYNTEFYRTHSSTTGAGDVFCIAQNTEYHDAAFEFGMWYLKGGMAPLVKGGRIPLWNGIDKEQVLNVLKENAADSFDQDSMNKYLSIDTTKGVKSVQGYAKSEIGAVWTEEYDAMCYGRQSIDDTINNMMTRSAELIKVAMESKK